MFQDLIASRSCYKIHACLNQLSNGYCITILPIQTNQSGLWSECKAFQVGRNGLECSCEFTTIVAVASACIGADPLAGMHLKSDGTGAYDLASFSPGVAWRTDRL